MNPRDPIALSIPSLSIAVFMLSALPLGPLLELWLVYPLTILIPGFAVTAFSRLSAIIRVMYSAVVGLLFYMGIGIISLAIPIDSSFFSYRVLAVLLVNFIFLVQIMFRSSTPSAPNNKPHND